MSAGSNRPQPENKLIFLSIGYSTCHWCHVMEEDSFVREDVADILNQHFISIKVDRETHPAVDELYTNALLQVTGSSGWPVTAVINSKGEPVFIQSFVPREKFKKLLTRLATMWQTQAQFLNQNAANVMKLVNEKGTMTNADWNKAMLAETLDKTRASLDPDNGGYAGAPKFPSEGLLLNLLDELTHRWDPKLAKQVETHLDAMAERGLWDAINGGFHRYATDAVWKVPHFEKMLYNQAQLLMVYQKAKTILGRPDYQRVIDHTLLFLDKWLFQPDQGYFSAIDAVYQTEDGKFYLWTDEQLAGIEEKVRQAAGMRLWTFNMTGRKGVLLDKPESEAAGKVREHLTGLQGERPHIDRKIITAWNALLLTALANIDQQKALALGETLWQKHFDAKTGQLYRHTIEGKPEGQGTLADYAFLAQGLLALYDAVGDKKWLARAERLAKVANARFADGEGGFYFADNSQSAGMLQGIYKTRDGELLPAGAVMVEVIDRLDRPHTGWSLEENSQRRCESPQGPTQCRQAQSPVCRKSTQYGAIQTHPVTAVLCRWQRGSDSE